MTIGHVTSLPNKVKLLSMDKIVVPTEGRDDRRLHRCTRISCGHEVLAASKMSPGARPTALMVMEMVRDGSKILRSICSIIESLHMVDVLVALMHVRATSN